MSSTALAKLLKLFSSPEVEGDVMCDEDLETLQFVRKNKLLDLYLERISRSSRDTYILKSMVEREGRRALFRDAVVNTARNLDESGVEYALFKTLKPFRFLPNDIDILIFDMENLEMARAALTEAGYVLGEYEPYVVSFSSPEGVMVELHLEMSIAYFVYLDKALLKPHVTCVNIDGVRVYTLKPSAELLCTIAHLLFKENMITLSDYMEIRVRMGRQLNDGSEEFRRLVDRSSMELGVYLVLKMVLLLDRRFLSDYECCHMECLCEDLRVNCKYANIMDLFLNKLMNKPIFPHKFHPTVLMLLFIDRIIKDDRARSSLASQVFNTLDVTNPYSRRMREILISRIGRESY